MRVRRQRHQTHGRRSRQRHRTDERNRRERDERAPPPAAVRRDRNLFHRSLFRCIDAAEGEQPVPAAPGESGDLALVTAEDVGEEVVGTGVGRPGSSREIGGEHEPQAANV